MRERRLGFWHRKLAYAERARWLLHCQILDFASPHRLFDTVSAPSAAPGRWIIGIVPATSLFWVVMLDSWKGCTLRDELAPCRNFNSCDALFSTSLAYTSSLRWQIS